MMFELGRILLWLVVFVVGIGVFVVVGFFFYGFYVGVGFFL